MESEPKPAALSASSVRICLGCGELYEVSTGNGRPGFCVRCRAGPIAAVRTATDSGTVTSAVRRMRRSLIESGILSRAAGSPLPIAQPGQVLQGRYKVLHELGATLLSQVYLAFDVVLSRKVVIKYLNLSDQPRLVDRFRREATMLANLKHPNIVSVYDSGLERGRPYIVMEYIEGIDLERFNAGLVQGKDEAGRIRRILEVAFELCHALDYLHAQGIVHRDIKPTNVILDRLGKPYVIDFGVAKQESAADRMTAAGAVLGTMLYMAPEQAEGRGDEVDARSDIYSLGILLYQLLAGTLPFRGKSYDELMRNVHTTEPPPLSQLNPLVPPGVDRLVRKCIARSQDQRYQRASELARDLEPYVLGGKAEVIGPRPRRWNSWFLGSAAGLLGLLALTVVLAFVLPALEGKRGNKAANPGKVRTSLEEKFDLGMLPLEFERVIGTAEARDGYLWLSEGLVLFSSALERDWFELSFRLEPDGDRFPEEIRIGMHVEKSDPSVRGTFVRLFPRPAEGLIRCGDRFLARFSLPPWSDSGCDIDLVKRESNLELRVGGRLAVEVTLPGSAGRSGGPFALQVIDGSARVDRISLMVREGWE